MIFKKTNLVLVVLVLLSASALAQSVNSAITNDGTNTKLTNQELGTGLTDQDNKSAVADDSKIPTKIVNAQITTQKVESGITNQVINQSITNRELNSGVEFNTEAIFREKEVLDPNKIYIKTNKELTQEIQSAIYDLRVRPDEIFSQVFSSVENLVVNPTIEDKKVVYNLVVKDKSKPIFREKEVAQPIFDLRVDKPVEFMLEDNRIIVNNEQIIDYKAIVRENEIMPPIELEINSAITDNKIHILSLVIGNMQHKEREHVSYFIWMPNTTETIGNENVQDWEVRGGRSMPIYSDFKIEDKQLYLLENDKPYDVRINPPEIYSAVYDLTVKEPKIVVKELALGIENKKAVYDLRVEEPAKILWIFPTTVESKYLINPADGSAELVNSQWYITSEKIAGGKDNWITFIQPE